MSTMDRPRCLDCGGDARDLQPGIDPRYQLGICERQERRYQLALQRWLQKPAGRRGNPPAHPRRQVCTWDSSTYLGARRYNRALQLRHEHRQKLHTEAVIGCPVCEDELPQEQLLEAARA